ncbi:MAG TPA: UDP-3-O-(3-hydroxymyristoyl)glucosamine N-acyltransferase [Terracidiphilus sp.]|nr:UDP-3-O-(3-hydroxymyristoyl)glucosamine N-acyltransferase [Terracidiphilus sp.]
MTLGELIQRLGGRLVKGSEETEILAVASVERATTFDLIFATDELTLQTALKSSATAVVANEGASPSDADGSRVEIIECGEPRLWFSRAAKLLAPQRLAMGVHPSAVVGTQVKFGSNVTISPHAVIGDSAEIGAETRVGSGAVVGVGVKIGSHCRVFPRVVLYPGTTIGDRVIIHAGAVLGADGFGYVRDPLTGEYAQFPQQGTLTIEDDVEIGANSTIDRGALLETRIRRGTKIDNQVHIAHNCDIGEDVVIAALTGISGSSTVGRGAVIAGQVGIGDHAHVGPGVVLGGQAGIFSGKTVQGNGAGEVFYGTPARPIRQVLREQAALAKLAKSEPETDGDL